jgi:hypothetical protein
VDSRRDRYGALHEQQQHTDQAALGHGQLLKVRASRVHPDRSARRAGERPYALGVLRGGGQPHRRRCHQHEHRSYVTDLHDLGFDNKDDGAATMEALYFETTPDCAPRALTSVGPAAARDQDQ